MQFYPERREREDGEQKVEKVAEEHVRVDVGFFLAIGTANRFEKYAYWLQIFLDPGNQM